jgi:hypothetical protein
MEFMKVLRESWFDVDERLEDFCNVEQCRLAKMMVFYVP